MFFDDGGEHSPSSCEQKARAPKNLIKKQQFMKIQNYLGSLQIEFADKNEAGIDAWNHYFTSSGSCQSSFKKLNRLYAE